ncbi:6-phosphofructokinase [Phycisphaera mikurensis]|uniref:Pyrophosphate--fructose 6-phosphate 1-phosphotransferase n=1 Tax=Phycisphaera mikurensis (strain NBRC 102666 / KCTC 22515 / FYK2301M01) TaxID=1142394 RepID=I0IJ92_PHYMF|nr:6-phosphofructokinase [Phycisphaera mikurensis]MBB6441870.1 6-phosphofructokinase 1 [Phycisphaera mikurensis]BAM05330.1 6-phosphofructokinase [Phycisphaera mikurensis NBRC 102666]
MNAVVGQSGGPTAVINQSLAGVVETLQQRSDFTGKILGARHAVAGVVRGDFADLTGIDAEKLDLIAGTPSSALGSSRDKPDAAYCERIFESFTKHDVGYFFYAGGNDSSDTCRIVAEMAGAKGYDLKAFHVPKTIDNDLKVNDHTPGFGSAAKFVAQAFMGDDLDNRALPGIKINVVMGRHAGFLTAASLAGVVAEDSGPHLVCVPEVTFDEEKFIDDVERVYKKLGRCLVAVSEGIHDADGNAIITKLQEDVEKDAHGNVQLSGTGALGDLLADLVKKKLGDRLGQKLRVRADTFGYLQRSFVGCVSEVDAAEARQAGREAVKAAFESGRGSGSIAIVRTSSSPYAVDYKTIDIAEVAALTRHMPEAFLGGERGVTEAFVDYVKPIIGELPAVGLL